MGAIRNLTDEQRAARQERKSNRAERHLQAKQRQGVQTCTGRSRQTGLPCRMKAIHAGKCKFHGGARPKTPEALERQRAGARRGRETAARNRAARQAKA